MWVTWVMDVRRDVPFWLDHLVKRGVLKVTARRGRTSGAFSIERTLNGRSLGSPIEANLEETYRHLTSFANVEMQLAVLVCERHGHTLANRGCTHRRPCDESRRFETMCAAAAVEPAAVDGQEGRRGVEIP